MDIRELNEMNFNDAIESRNNVSIVDFYADWCGPCKMLGPILQELALEYTNINFFKVNVDDSANLARIYGVMSIPTLIFFKNNKVEKTLVGLQGKNELINIIKELDN